MPINNNNIFQHILKITVYLKNNIYEEPLKESSFMCNTF